jgi:hypothetical protein
MPPRIPKTFYFNPSAYGGIRNNITINTPRTRGGGVGTVKITQEWINLDALMTLAEPKYGTPSWAHYAMMQWVDKSTRYLHLQLLTRYEALGNHTYTGQLRASIGFRTRMITGVARGIGEGKDTARTLINNLVRHGASARGLGNVAPITRGQYKGRHLVEMATGQVGLYLKRGADTDIARSPRSYGLPMEQGVAPGNVKFSREGIIRLRKWGEKKLGIPIPDSDSYAEAQGPYVPDGTKFNKRSSLKRVFKPIKSNYDSNRLANARFFGLVRKLKATGIYGYPLMAHVFGWNNMKALGMSPEHVRSQADNWNIHRQTLYNYLQVILRNTMNDIAASGSTIKNFTIVRTPYSRVVHF